MIDRELLLRKLDGVRHHTGRLKQKLPASADALLADEDLRDIVSNNLSRAVQFAFDTATHLLTDGGAKVPDTYAEGFLLLGQLGAIDRDLALRLILASGLRNRLQHQYQAIDWRRVHESVSGGVDDFATFVSAIRRYLDQKRA